MEPERFRTSLLTVSVPARVLDSHEDMPLDVPFRYLMMEAEDVGERLRTGDFQRVRQRLWQDWEHSPLLRVCPIRA
jgi:hypothetical protein